MVLKATLTLTPKHFRSTSAVNTDKAQLAGQTVHHLFHVF